jgi:hypothetical protein
MKTKTKTKTKNKNKNKNKKNMCGSTGVHHTRFGSSSSRVSVDSRIENYPVPPILITGSESQNRYRF